jgi:hypothetical protein
VSTGTKKVARVVTEYKTLNSTYQVDTEAKRFRRVTGVNRELVGPDGEWVDYDNVAEIPTGDNDDDPFVLWFDRPNGRSLRTSLVQSSETVALTEGHPVSTDAEKVRAAAGYIELFGLHKGGLYDGRSLGRVAAPWDSPLESGEVIARRIPCCTYGALVAFGAEDATVARDLLTEFMRHIGRPDGAVGEWNDAEERTADEVVAALRSFADTLDADTPV